MPEQTITIGGREFQVACQPGEEPHLQAAAAQLDAQAQSVLGQGAQLSNARMLLLAGLLLADRNAEREQELAALRDRVAEAEAALGAMRARPERVEVPVLPADLGDELAELAARAEAVAERVEERGAAQG